MLFVLAGGFLHTMCVHSERFCCYSKFFQTNKKIHPKIKLFSFLDAFTVHRKCGILKMFLWKKYFFPRNNNTLNLDKTLFARRKLASTIFLAFAKYFKRYIFKISKFKRIDPLQHDNLFQFFFLQMQSSFVQRRTETTTLNWNGIIINYFLLLC